MTMTIRITKKGRELSDKLQPSLPSGIDMNAVRVICSNICRLATTHKILAERACERELTVRESALDAQIERDIRGFCLVLPQVNGKAITAEFQGDPRGATVKLVMPDGRGDSWCGTGRMCVPQ